METKYIFVYGTLRRGCANFNRLAADALTIEPAETTGLLYHLPQGYPAMFDIGQNIVYGEVMTFPNPEAVLVKFDILEGYQPSSPQNSHYQRIIKRVKILATGTAIDAWCYLYSSEKLAWVERHGIYIPDGDWLNFCMKSILRQPTYLWR